MAPLKEVDVTVNDDLTFEGTGTYWVDFRNVFPGGKKLTPKEKSITGYVSDDRLQIVTEGDQPDCSAGYWSGKIDSNINPVTNFKKE